MLLKVSLTRVVEIAHNKQTKQGGIASLNWFASVYTANIPKSKISSYDPNKEFNTMVSYWYFASVCTLYFVTDTLRQQFIMKEACEIINMHISILLKYL